MRAVVVVIRQPFIEIGLQLFNGAIYLAPERDLVKLLQNGLVEAFANAIGLRMAYLSLGMLDVVKRQVKLIVVCFGLAAVFRAPDPKYMGSDSI